MCVKKACVGLSAPGQGTNKEPIFSGQYEMIPVFPTAAVLSFQTLLPGMFEWSSEGQNACVLLAEPAFLGQPGTFRGCLGNDSPPSAIYTLRAALTIKTVPALPSLGVLGGGEVGFHPSPLLAKLRRSTSPLHSRQLASQAFLRAPRAQRLWLSVAV